MDEAGDGSTGPSWELRQKHQQILEDSIQRRKELEAVTAWEKEQARAFAILRASRRMRRRTMLCRIFAALLGTEAAAKVKVKTRSKWKKKYHKRNWRGHKKVEFIEPTAEVPEPDNTAWWKSLKGYDSGPVDPSILKKLNAKLTREQSAYILKKAAEQMETPEDAIRKTIAGHKKFSSDDAQQLHREEYLDADGSGRAGWMRAGSESGGGWMRKALCLAEDYVHHWMQVAPNRREHSVRFRGT